MNARPVTPIGILAARLGDLAELLDTPGQALAVREAIRESAALASGLDPYVQRCTTPESAALRALGTATAAHDWSGATQEQEMLSGHVEGQLLKSLVHATRAHRVLEIGTFTGYASLAMAEALPGTGRLITCEIDPDVAKLAVSRFRDLGFGDKVDVRVGPARETLAELGAAGLSFDLIFLDADKPGYRGYFDAVLDHGLLSRHGLLCADNTLLQGRPWCGEPSADSVAIDAFNAAVAADPRVEQVIIPLRDGVTLIRRTDGS